MPSRFPQITAHAVAHRIVHRPHTVTLSYAQATYNSLAEDISSGLYRSGPLGPWLKDLVLFIQGLIDAPDPDGLVTSARRLKDTDELVALAQEARSDIAALYDRFDEHTRSATEALEAITAWAALQEAADDSLRCAAA